MNNGNIAAGAGQAELKSVIERIERLEQEKKDISDLISDVFAEAKGNGYDAKILKKVIAIRRLPAHERQEQAAILEVYLNALGMERI